MSIQRFFAKHHTEIKKRSFAVGATFFLVCLFAGSAYGANGFAYWTVRTSPILIACVACFIAASRAERRIDAKKKDNGF